MLGDSDPETGLRSMVWK